MTIQKTNERAAAKVIGITLQTLAAFVFITGFVFLGVRAGLMARPLGMARYWQRVYIAISLSCIFGGIAWSVLSAFTLKVLYTSNDYKKLLGFGIANVIFIFTIPLTIIMIIIAKMECKK